MSGHIEPECGLLRQRIDEFITNDIAPDDRSAVEEHLQVCAECRKYWKAHNLLWQAMGDVPVPKPSADLIARTMKAVQVAQQRPVPVYQRAMPRLLAVAASLLLAFGLGVMLSDYFLDEGENMTTSTPANIAGMGGATPIVVNTDSAASREPVRWLSRPLAEEALARQGMITKPTYGPVRAEDHPAELVNVSYQDR